MKHSPIKKITYCPIKDRANKRKTYDLIFPSNLLKKYKSVLLFVGENGADYLYMKEKGFITSDDFVIAIESHCPEKVEAFLKANHAKGRYGIINKRLDQTTVSDVESFGFPKIDFSFFDICESMTPANLFAIARILKKCFANRYRIAIATALAGRANDLFRKYDQKHEYVHGLLEDDYNSIIDLNEADRLNSPSYKEKALWFNSVCHALVAVKSNLSTNCHSMIYSDAQTVMMNVAFDCQQTTKLIDKNYVQYLRKVFAQCLGHNIDDRLGHGGKIIDNQWIIDSFITEFCLGETVVRQPISEIILKEAANKKASIEKLSESELESESPLDIELADIELPKGKAKNGKKTGKKAPCSPSPRPAKYEYMTPQQWACCPVNPRSHLFGKVKAK